MLLLKFLLPPLLICLLSLAERKWGAAISGMLLGFPVTGGPVLFFLALEQGASFSVRTAVASLQGLIALAAFALTYSLVARSRGWLASILVAILVFLAISAAILEVPLRRPGWAFLLTCGALLATLWAFPRFSTSIGGANDLAGRELIWRMITAAVLVFVLTAVAPMVGPIASGLAVMVPVYTSILAVFNHMKSRARAMAMLKGLVTGAFSSRHLLRDRRLVFGEAKQRGLFCAGGTGLPGNADHAPSVSAQGLSHCACQRCMQIGDQGINP